MFKEAIIFYWAIAELIIEFLLFFQTGYILHQKHLFDMNLIVYSYQLCQKRKGVLLQEEIDLKDEVKKNSGMLEERLLSMFSRKKAFFKKVSDRRE
jgi:hypothetical protein